MPECCKLSKKIEVNAGGGYTDEQTQHFLGGSFQKYYLEILVTQRCISSYTSSVVI